MKYFNVTVDKNQKLRIFSVYNRRTLKIENISESEWNRLGLPSEDPLGWSEESKVDTILVRDIPNTPNVAEGILRLIGVFLKYNTDNHEAPYRIIVPNLNIAGVIRDIIEKYSNLTPSDFIIEPLTGSKNKKSLSDYTEISKNMEHIPSVNDLNTQYEDF